MLMMKEEVKEENSTFSICIDYCPPLQAKEALPACSSIITAILSRLISTISCLKHA